MPIWAAVLATSPILSILRFSDTGIVCCQCRMCIKSCKCKDEHATQMRAKAKWTSSKFEANGLCVITWLRRQWRDAL